MALDVEIPQIKATLRVMGASLEPDDVSKLLGLTADQAHRRGDPRKNKAHGSQCAPYSEGIWLLRSTETSPDVEAHIAELIKRLNGKDRAILDLKSKGFRVDVFLGIIGIEGNYGFTLSDSSLESLGRLGISVGFDLYTRTSVNEGGK